MKTIVEEILCHAEQTPERAAVITEEETLNYGRLGEMILKGMRWLLKHGAGQGDHILIEAVPEPMFPAAYFAIHGVGAIAVPVERKGEENLLKEIISQTAPKLFLKTGAESGPDSTVAVYSFGEMLEGAAVAGSNFHFPEADMVADLLFTSGTTSKPKGVMLTHQNIRAGAENIIEGVEMETQDVELLGLPLFHAQALGSLRALLMHGAAAVLQDGFASWNQIYSLLREKHCTAIGLVPSVLQILNELTKGKPELMLGGLRYIEIGTAPLSLDMRRRLMQQLPDTALCVNYGATESPRTIYHNLNKYPEKLLAIGRPMSRVRVEIVDENRTIMESSPDHLGVMAIYGPMNMKGYFGHTELTETVLEDGWFYTTDTAYKDADGFIYLTGRSKDIINVGGEKVAVSEIEDILSLYEGILEAACIGAKDPSEILGEVPIAFVVGQPGSSLTAEKLRKYLGKKLKAYKIPVYWFFIEELPRNFMGKIDKNKLREYWEENKHEK